MKKEKKWKEETKEGRKEEGIRKELMKKGNEPSDKKGSKQRKRTGTIHNLDTT